MEEIINPRMAGPKLSDPDPEPTEPPPEWTWLERLRWNLFRGWWSTVADKLLQDAHDIGHIDEWLWREFDHRLKREPWKRWERRPS